MVRTFGQLLACHVWALLNVIAPVCAQKLESKPDENQLAELERRFQAGMDGICEEFGLPGMTAAYVLPDGQVAVLPAGWPIRRAARR